MSAGTQFIIILFKIAIYPSNDIILRDLAQQIAPFNHLRGCYIGNYDGSLWNIEEVREKKETEKRRRERASKRGEERERERKKERKRERKK